LREISRASAPAKVILFGEHFVVYDRLAIVMAIDLRACVTVKPRGDKKIIIRSNTMGLSGEFSFNGDYKPILGGFECIRLKPIYIAAKNVLNLAGEVVGLDINIESEIPVASGLGSSAAVSVATTAAVGNLLEMSLSKDDIFKLALEAERVVHENPSGVDPAVSTYGGVLAYRRSGGIMRLKVNADLPLVLGDTRVIRDTRKMVLHVSEIKRLYPEVVDGIMGVGELVANLAIKALEDGDLITLGHLMNINHALLYAIGVSNLAVERLVWAARQAGALGAKITGAGGGGCIIALSLRENLYHVAESIRVADGNPLIVNMASMGVKIEG